MSLPAWSGRLVSELEDADRRAQSVAERLTPEQLNWRPAPGAWSVGQCLEHLYHANQVYLPAIAAALNGRSPTAALEIRLGRISRWFIRNYIAPNPQGKRARAPKKIQPAEMVQPDVLADFLRSNQSARELVRRAAGYDVNAIRFRNPFIPLVRFTVGTGLEIITSHQSRHLLQAERVRGLAKFPR
jgi:DinB family protein